MSNEENKSELDLKTFRKASDTNVTKYDNSVSLQEVDMYFKYLDYYTTQDLVEKIIKIDSIGSPKKQMFYLSKVEAFVNMSPTMVRDWAMTFYSRNNLEGTTLEIGGDFGNRAGTVKLYNKRVKEYQIYPTQGENTKLQRKFIETAYPDENKSIFISTAFNSGMNYDSIFSLYKLSEMSDEELLKLKPVICKVKKAFIIWHNNRTLPSWFQTTHQKTFSIVLNIFDGKASQVITW